MEFEEALVRAGELLGDRSRLQMLMALVDEQSWPAGDLARRAEIQPATASYHLEQLVAGGLLQVIPQGRHRYYRLGACPLIRIMPTISTIYGTVSRNCGIYCSFARAHGNLWTSS